MFFRRIPLLLITCRHLLTLLRMSCWRVRIVVVFGRGGLQIDELRNFIDRRHWRRLGEPFHHEDRRDIVLIRHGYGWSLEIVSGGWSLLEPFAWPVAISLVFPNRNLA